MLHSFNQCYSHFSCQLTCHAMTTDKATGAGNLLIHHTTTTHKRRTLWIVCEFHCFMHSNNTEGRKGGLAACTLNAVVMANEKGQKTVTPLSKTSDVIRCAFRGAMATRKISMTQP